jgi:hypothetical protein
MRVTQPPDILVLGEGRGSLTGCSVSGNGAAVPAVPAIEIEFAGSARGRRCQRKASFFIKKEGTPASFRLKMATIVAIPNNNKLLQQVTADEDRGRLVRRP